MSVTWKGVFPAVTTKLKADGSLDEAAIKAGLERLIEGGVGGVVMMGMVGENASLTPEEKRTVLRIAKETVAGRVPVISGVAETNTASAIEFARAAEEIGVNGLMVFPGLTYKSDARETVEFYRSVARSTSLDILLYNNPRGYGVDLTPDLLEQLQGEKNIVAIKEESYDTTRVTDLLTRFGDRYAVVCGVDDLILESVALGATCWVSGMANAVPRESVTLLELAVSGDFAAARKLYRVLTPLYHLDTHVKLVQYIKLAENITAGYSEVVKAPRLALEGAERERVVAIVQKTVEDLKALG
ncbi:dihydrodipicolinate synthase family protein [Cupriavidus sp. AcVe19-6a]|uniref:dihydrodipicolinate synthase family protein n=1 Tax=Cupriavidus sp. AcVe19-6a TaxID=2821358 RepID=UPI001AE93982|nr:dihydrodipicolinate synthase family protein [Cupriavidus sp. AcVe19-6a]MBP0639738.1 dihydrodipicolinate synthase family protein [Cupriavidus sp. AcVe19-6a]